MQHYTFTAQIELDKESGFYVGSVPVLPGAHTQAKSLDELQVNLKEVVELCLESLISSAIFYQTSTGGYFVEVAKIVEPNCN